MNRRDLLKAALTFAAASAVLGPRTALANPLDLRVVYFETFPPLSYRDANNRMTGILIDGMDATFGSSGSYTLTHEGYPWARAQHLVETGEADAFITNATEARQVYASFGSVSV